MSTAFADPAKYQLYDCKQLEAERKNLANRSAELQGLMAKAETGVAGPVVAETRLSERIRVGAWAGQICRGSVGKKQMRLRAATGCATGPTCFCTAGKSQSATASLGRAIY